MKLHFTAESAVTSFAVGPTSRPEDPSKTEVVPTSQAWWLAAWRSC